MQKYNKTTEQLMIVRDVAYSGVKVKVKQSRYRPEVAQRVPGS